MTRKPLDITTAELADGELPTFTSVRNVVGKKTANDPAPRAMVAYGRTVSDARPSEVTQKRRAKKQEKPDIVPAAAAVAEAARPIPRSVYEICGISEVAYSYPERTFVEYADNIALKSIGALHQHAYDVGVHPSESKSHLLDLLEAQYLKRYPDRKAEAARVRQADRERLTPSEFALNPDNREAAAMARKKARENGEGMSIRERAVAIMQRGK
jgi:hypothetical protein